MFMRAVLCRNRVVFVSSSRNSALTNELKMFDVTTRVSWFISWFRRVCTSRKNSLVLSAERVFNIATCSDEIATTEECTASLRDCRSDEMDTTDPTRI
jgi:hypothetical protein